MTHTRPMHAADVERWLAARGWELKRHGATSHCIYYNAQLNRSVTVSFHGRQFNVLLVDNLQRLILRVEREAAEERRQRALAAQSGSQAQQQKGRRKTRWGTGSTPTCGPATSARSAPQAAPAGRAGRPGKSRRTAQAAG